MLQTKPRDMIYSFLFLLAVLVVWTGLSLLPGPQSAPLAPDVQGGYDLTSYDFEDTVYVSTNMWDAWAERLYTPLDLDTADAPVPQNSLDFQQSQYGTYRLRLNLVPGITYGISMWSAEYAQRLYIDGVEVGSVGTPGATLEETVPRAGRVTYYFIPQSETTEMVMQTANFVHKEGGWPPHLTIGTAGNITRLDGLARMKTGLIFGCLLTAGLYHLAIFLMNRRQRATLVFACLCVLLAFSSGDFLMFALPGYNWFVTFRLQYLCMVLVTLLLLALMRLLFPRAVGRRLVWGYCALCSVYMVLVLATPTTFFTRALIWFEVAAAAIGTYALIRLMRTLREGKHKNVLAFLGIVVVALLGVNKALYQSGAYPSGSCLWLLGRNFDGSAGMVLFVFCYAMVLSIGQSEVNQMLEKSRAALAAAETRYEELQEAQKNAPTPHTSLSDFGLTKREYEIALLLLDGKSREEVSLLLSISRGTVNTHCTNIYRKANCNSVGEFTRRMLLGDQK